MTLTEGIFAKITNAQQRYFGKPDTELHPNRKMNAEYTDRNSRCH